MHPYVLKNRTCLCTGFKGSVLLIYKAVLSGATWDWILLNPLQTTTHLEALYLFPGICTALVGSGQFISKFMKDEVKGSLLLQWAVQVQLKSGKKPKQNSMKNRTMNIMGWAIHTDIMCITQINILVLDKRRRKMPTAKHNVQVLYNVAHKCLLLHAFFIDMHLLGPAYSILCGRPINTGG